MIILNYTKKIFRIWFPKAYFGFIICIFAASGILSCSSAKNNSPDKKADTSLVTGKIIPGDFSITPNCFRAEASLLDTSSGALKEKMIYTFLIENVLERESSLIHVVASGDSIQAESPFSSMRLQKKDRVIIVIEERMLLNSELPLLILKSIHKK